MRPNLEKKGITAAADQRAIIRELLKRFHTMLEGIAQEPGVVYVRTPGTLAENEWNDELHPTRRGFEKGGGEVPQRVEEAVSANVLKPVSQDGPATVMLHFSLLI